MISAGRKLTTDVRLWQHGRDGSVWLQLEEPVLKIEFGNSEAHTACAPVAGNFRCGDSFVNVEKGNRLVIKNLPAPFDKLTIFSRDTKPDAQYLATVDRLTAALAGNDAAIYHIVQNLADRGLFDKAVQITSKIEDQFSKDDSFAYIVRTMSAAGQFDDALKTARMVSASYPSVLIPEIVSAMAEAGFFDRAVETAKEIKCEDLKNSALSKIFLAMAETGMFERALDTAKELCDENYEGSLSLEQTDNTFSQIADMMANAGEFYLALDAVHEISELSYEFPEALLNVITKMANAGEFDMALEAAEELDDHEKAVALAKIAKAKGGDEALFNESIRIARTSPHPFVPLSAISKLMAEAGLVDRALEIAPNVQTMINIASIAPAERRVEILKRAKRRFTSANADDCFLLALAFAKAGQIGEALELAGKTEGHDTRNWHLNSIIDAVLKRGPNRTK